MPTREYANTRRPGRWPFGKRSADRALPAALAGMALLGLPMCAAADLDARQMRLLMTKCVQCHAVPHTGAPQMGRVEDWLPVHERGEDATLTNVVQGVRGMPPLGYCSACSEADLLALTRFVAGFPKQPVEAN